MFSFINNIGPWEIINLVFLLPYILLYLFVYLLPVIIAYWRSKSDIKKIFIVNLLLGWTVIGWIVALIWAVSINENNLIETKEPSEWAEVIDAAKSKGITPQMLKSLIDR